MEMHGMNNIKCIIHVFTCQLVSAAVKRHQAITKHYTMETLYVI
jgi:hypothetical protein